MKRNGFTLIELLAVIVILAIIAIIATPIVLNIINNAKTSSNERSGELYVKAVENAIMKKQMSGTDVVEDGDYTVQSDGSICIVSNNACREGTTIEVSVEGDTPTEGTITVSNGVVASYNLVVSGTSVTNGENSDDSTDTICTLVSGTSKSEGAKYSCKVNDTDTFYFYVLGDEDDNYINLIMDRNICDSGEAATEDNSCNVNWITQTEYLNNRGISPGYNSQGPITALKFLKSATSTWTNIDYDYGTLVDEAGSYSNISLSEYHARMPKISDIYDGTESDFYDYLDTIDYDYYTNNQNKYYLFDNLALYCYNEEGDDVSCNSEEVDEIEGINREGMTHISDNNSYWFSTASGLGDSSAYRINLLGFINQVSVFDSRYPSGTSGIRPVITISKNQLN